jgi:hypothetical protein
MAADLRSRGIVWARPLVALRHLILLAFALLSAWGVRSDADWSVLSRGGNALFGHAPFSTYASNPGLQAGAPALAVVRVLNLLPGIGGELAAHLLLAFLGWLMLFLAERWTVKGATFLDAPTGSGLLTLVVGLPVLKEWAALAGALPHVEDALSLLTFLLAVRAVSQRRPELAGVLVGLTAAWKPWAVVALPLLWGLPRRRRAFVIAIAIPVACWLPFVLGDPHTLSAVSDNFSLRADSTLHVLGLHGLDAPNWWRTVELLGAFSASAIAALRRDWRVAFAAGCAARILLDPAGFDYYVAGLIMATALTERMSNLRPWRTALLLVSMVYVTPGLSTHAEVQLRFFVLSFVTASWLYRWHIRGPFGAASPQTGVCAPADIPLPRASVQTSLHMANALVSQGQTALKGLHVPPSE